MKPLAMLVQCLSIWISELGLKVQPSLPTEDEARDHFVHVPGSACAGEAEAHLHLEKVYQLVPDIPPSPWLGTMFMKVHSLHCKKCGALMDYRPVSPSGQA